MALGAAFTELGTNMDSLSLRFQDFAGSKSVNSATDFTILDECVLEGLLSRVWQAWNLFCRTCVIRSCVGAIDASGNMVGALPEALSEDHVSGAAIRAKRQPNGPFWGSQNTLLVNEPTWGDVDVLTKVLTRLRPTNSPKMLAAFSSSHRHAKALQAIRNCAAHTNQQTMANVQNLRSAYLVFPITHPTHALFWIEPNSRNYLVTGAIEELKDAGKTAVT
jgi:hypothetical protein